MKGVEGLPLKYIALIVVAALVIGVVFGIVNMFASTATGTASDTLETMDAVSGANNMNSCLIGGGGWDNTTSTCCITTNWNGTNCCEDVNPVGPCVLK